MIGDLIALLLTASAVTALVDNRIRPGSRDQEDALPSISVNRISGAPEYADDGEAGISEHRVQVDCWADTYTGAHAVAVAVQTALSAIQDVTQGATTFIFITLETTRDMRETGTAQADYPFRVSLDFSVWH